MASEGIHIIPSDQEPMQNGDTTTPVPNGPPNREPRIPGFRIVDSISKHSGQGDVYLAEQLNENGLIRAIKVLRSTAPEFEEQIEREIALLSKINHPAFVAFVLHGRTEDGRIFFAMEYFPGEPFSIATLRQWNFGFRQTLEAFYRICLAVDVMHSEGITHKDLKPGNILMDEFGTIKVIDLGLAGILALTNRGYAEYQAGTPAYMSPEQAEAGKRAIKQPSDVYSLGVILYQVLTGAFPYEKTGDLELLLSRIREDVPPPLRRLWGGYGVPHDSKTPENRRCPIDRRLERIVQRCLEKQPRDRYANAGALADDIQSFLNERPLAPPLRSTDDTIILNYRMFSRRHRITHFALLVAAVCIVGGIIGVPLVYSTSVNTHFVRLISEFAGDASQLKPLDLVRVISHSPKTDFHALARNLSIAPHSGDEYGTRRMVHGHLMAMLAESRCRVVAWDLGFNQVTGGDDAFAVGVKALVEKGVPVVLTVGRWHMDQDPLKTLSPTIAKTGIQAGATVGGCDHADHLSSALVAQRGENRPRISLALASLAAALRPEETFDLDLDHGDESVNLLFDRGPSMQIDLTRIETVGVTEGELTDTVPNLRAGDKVGVFVLPTFPSPQELEAISVSYEDVLAASDAQRTEWFSDKAVVIGAIGYGDRVVCDRSGKSLDGVYLQAVAIDGLLRGYGIKDPTWRGERGLAASGAALGCLVGLASPFVTRRRMMALIALSVASFIVSVAAYHSSLYQFNPLFPLVMVLIGAEGTAAVRRVTAGGPEPI